MANSERTAETKTVVEIEITRCPECGTEWETVVTKRCDPRRAERVVQR